MKTEKRLIRLTDIITGRNVDVIADSIKSANDRPMSAIDNCDHPEIWRIHYTNNDSWCNKCWSYLK